MNRLFNRIPQIARGGRRAFHTAHFDTYEEGKKVFHHNTRQFYGLLVGVLVIGPVYLWWSESAGVLPKAHYIWAEDAKPAFFHTRKKPFSWECYDCSLFDRECHRKCKAEIAEKKAAWEKLQAKQ
jgi:hypothetical protein